MYEGHGAEKDHVDQHWSTLGMTVCSGGMFTTFVHTYSVNALSWQGVVYRFLMVDRRHVTGLDGGQKNCNGEKNSIGSCKSVNFKPVTCKFAKSVTAKCQHLQYN